ncbi:MAG: hypothetical protein AAF483_23715 [Planctomycetota bacterium]
MTILSCYLTADELATTGIENVRLDLVLGMIVCLAALALLWCGVQMIRLKSRTLSYVGAFLSIALFLPAGLVVAILTYSALGRKPVREFYRVHV